MKLDFGCGKNKREGFDGVDSIPFDGVDHVVDLSGPWPFQDNCMDEGHSSHAIEHLDAKGRANFIRELWRVSKPGAKTQIIVPHWGSCRAYGDLTHQWPPVSEFWFYYLNKEWRAANAPHNAELYGDADFDCTWGYSLNPALTVRNAEYQQHAIGWFKESVWDIVATLVARK